MRHLIKSWIDDINPANTQRQHRIDESRLLPITGTIPPVLVVASDGNGMLILDGHHRIEAARRAGLQAIPAIIISRDDYNTLLDDEFGGSAPSNLRDIDDYIDGI